VPNTPEKTIEVLCPYCNKYHHYNVDLGFDSYQLSCLKRKRKKFRSHFVNIRAKRRNTESNGTRNYRVRILDSQHEDLIVFSDTRYSDVELRGGDRAILTYLGKRLYRIENLTIRGYYDIKRPINWGRVLQISFLVLILACCILSSYAPSIMLYLTTLLQ